MTVPDHGFIPIPISEFTQGVLTPVDLHIRLNEEKFVLVARAGLTSNLDQFRNYQNKEVNYLWVRKGDYSKVTQQAVSLAGLVVKKTNFAERPKTRIITQAASSVFRQVEHLGFDQESYDGARQVADAVATLVEYHIKLSDLIAGLAATGDRFLAHSMGVAVMAVIIGRKMGYEKRSTVEKFALGGLLHDIGKKVLPPFVCTKPRFEMTPDELEIYKTHCFHGSRILKNVEGVGDELISMALEHHEIPGGHGFPQGLSDGNTHPMAKVVALANAYTNLIIANPSNPNPIKPIEALVYLENQGAPYNREALRALKKALEASKSSNAA